MISPMISLEIVDNNSIYINYNRENQYSTENYEDERNDRLDDEGNFGLDAVSDIDVVCFCNRRGL